MKNPDRVFAALRALETAAERHWVPGYSYPVGELPAALTAPAVVAVREMVDCYLRPSLGAQDFRSHLAESVHYIEKGESCEAVDRIAAATMCELGRMLYAAVCREEYVWALQLCMWTERIEECLDRRAKALSESDLAWAAELWGGNARTAVTPESFLADDYLAHFDGDLRTRMQTAVESPCAWDPLVAAIRERLDFACHPRQVARLLLVLWAVEAGKISTSLNGGDQPRLPDRSESHGP